MWPALENGLPFAAIAIGLMTVVAFTTMRRGHRRWLKALITSIVSCAVFVGALALVVYLANVLALNSSLPFVLGLIVALPTWYVVTKLIARGIAGSGERRQRG